MGNFAVATFKEGGMTNDNLGFMPFPEITPGGPRAEDAPTGTIHFTAGATNGADAKLFLADGACADAQTKLNATLGQLPANKNSTVAADDPVIPAGFTMPSEAYALSAMAGFALCVCKFRFNMLLLFIFVAGSFVSFQILMVPVHDMTVNLGLIDTTTGHGLFHGTFQTGFCTLFLPNFIKACRSN